MVWSLTKAGRHNYTILYYTPLSFSDRAYCIIAYYGMFYMLCDFMLFDLVLSQCNVTFSDRYINLYHGICSVLCIVLYCMGICSVLLFNLFYG